MRVCPITYALLSEEERGPYSAAGLRRLSRMLKDLADLPLSAEDQRIEAARRARKMSIQGVQPKLSARLRVREGRFEVVDRMGQWILKPQSPHFPHLPENEDLTQRLAGAAGIEVPVHGLVRSSDQSLTYFIRRFDRPPRGGKRAMEDFAQLSGRTRDTKYDSSMEKVAKVIEEFATFPAVEKLELFRRTVFCFLAGNEDMHLKNFSLLTDGPRVRLSPAYDMVSSTLALPATEEEMALPIRGKRRRLRREDLVDYYAVERLGLDPRAVERVLREVSGAFPAWNTLIDRSFLPEDRKRVYRELIAKRRSRLG
ncbi:MAG: HipA domain-containing protein, partial [Planctomycetes bacterium]|nr:HipA domain-containing protein [Planctomycetota bacterium]